MQSVRRQFFPCVGGRRLRVPIVNHWKEQHNASCDARGSRQGADSMGGNTLISHCFDCRGRGTSHYVGPQYLAT